MNPCSFHLTQAQACELQSAYLSAQNPQTKTRFQAVRLYETGDCSHQSEDICACSPRSLLRGCQSYRDRGITALCDGRIGGNRARLTPNRSKRFGTNFTPTPPLNSQDRQIAGAKGSCWTLAHLAVLLKRDYVVVLVPLQLERNSSESVSSEVRVSCTTAMIVNCCELRIAPLMSRNCPFVKDRVA